MSRGLKHVRHGWRTLLHPYSAGGSLGLSLVVSVRLDLTPSNFRVEGGVGGGALSQGRALIGLIWVTVPKSGPITGQDQGRGWRLPLVHVVPAGGRVKTQGWAGWCFLKLGGWQAGTFPQIKCPTTVNIGV